VTAVRVIISGGGTGGHIYPAIAIADRIMEMRPDTEILFVGTEKGMERDLAPKNGYPIRFITVTGLNRKKIFKNFKVLMDLRKGLREARRIIKEFKPDIVIGTGGYVCGPVVKAASELGVRTFIHEQNASPGLTNKILEKYVEKVFIGFEEARGCFKNKNKIVFTGNPVRKEFFSAKRTAARAKLGVPDGDFMAVSFGGSLGAVKINEVMTEVAATLSGIGGISVFFATGGRYYDGVIENFKARDISLCGNIRVLPFLYEMDQYLAACDAVISRAGAITISEILVCGKPAILIPSPNVTGNHQFYNAKALADKGGAILIEEKDLSAENLIGALMKMKDDKGLSREGAESPLNNSAADVICDNIGIGTGP